MPNKRTTEPNTAAIPPSPAAAKKPRHYDLSEDASEDEAPEDVYRSGVSGALPGELLKDEEEIELGETVYSLAKRKNKQWALYACRPVADDEPLRVEVAEVGVFPATEIISKLDEILSDEEWEYVSATLGDDLRAAAGDELDAKGEFLGAHILGYPASESSWYLVEGEGGTWTLWVTGDCDTHPLSVSFDALDTYPTKEEALAAYREQTGDEEDEEGEEDYDEE